MSAVHPEPIGSEAIMVPRANWKGVLKIGEVSCPVALYTVATTSDRIVFHTLNRKTGHRCAVNSWTAK